MHINSLLWSVSDLLICGSESEQKEARDILIDLFEILRRFSLESGHQVIDGILEKLNEGCKLYYNDMSVAFDPRYTTDENILDVLSCADAVSLDILDVVISDIKPQKRSTVLLLGYCVLYTLYRIYRSDSCVDSICAYLNTMSDSEYTFAEALSISIGKILTAIIKTPKYVKEKYSCKLTPSVRIVDLLMRCQSYALYDLVNPSNKQEERV